MQSPVLVVPSPREQVMVWGLVCPGHVLGTSFCCGFNPGRLLGTRHHAAACSHPPVGWGRELER